ncbi:transcription factor sdnS [Cladorrhinum sp. PSN332]|nr:transcription factor sdnS [Cladorrhinum sp. PSN332]
MTEIPPQQTEAEVRRRKVRKGTHSCWECRRRKIRCQFGAGDDAVCLPCQARGTVCRSQEFIDSQPPQVPDRRLAQRLGRLEDLMAKVVDRVMPEAGSGPSSARNYSRYGSPTASNYTGSMDDEDAGYRLPTVDVLGSSVVEENSADGVITPIRTASSNGNRRSSNARGLPSKNDRISQTLHGLFPSQKDVDAITKVSVGKFLVISLFSCHRGQVEGKCETPDTVSIIPPPNSHPTVLSKRLLQLSVCLNDYPAGTGDVPPLQMQTPTREHLLNVLSAVNHLVTTNDDLIATAEGLQTLVLAGYLDANLGNLRKSWLTFRRAISLGILMGIDRPAENTTNLKYADPSIPLGQRPTAQALWYRINACDRSMSLMLGLPVGSQSNSFATEAAMARDTQQERLAKLHTVLARRIIEHKAITSTQEQQQKSQPGLTYLAASRIDQDLENAARALGKDWWTIPCLDSSLDQPTLLARASHLMLQIHHFHLKNILHLPFMMRAERSSSTSTGNSPEETQSKAACCSASREILKRYITFRSKLPAATWPCRQADFSSLVAAITLLLRYLNRDASEGRETVEAVKGQEEDRRLLEIVQERMQHLAVVNRDKLSRESAEIIGQMLPVLLTPGEQEDGQTGLCLHINVPYFGIISVHPVQQRGTGSRAGPGGIMGDSSTQMHIDYSGIDPALGGHGGFHHPHSQHPGMHMQYESHAQGHEGFGELPLTSPPEDWVFQGIESSYWSLMNPNGMQG